MAEDRVREELADTLSRSHMYLRSTAEIADALLPTVRRIVAEELRAAAKAADIKTPFGYALDANGLRARADAIEAGQ